MEKIIKYFGLVSSIVICALLALTMFFVYSPGIKFFGINFNIVDLVIGTEANKTMIILVTTFQPADEVFKTSYGLLMPYIFMLASIFLIFISSSIPNKKAYYTVLGLTCAMLVIAGILLICTPELLALSDKTSAAILGKDVRYWTKFSWGLIFTIVMCFINAALVLVKIFFPIYFEKNFEVVDDKNQE